jgi:cell division protein DivIC
MRFRFHIPAFFRSYYFIFSVSFLMWMLFFDVNDFITQYQLFTNVKRLEHDKEYYQEKIDEVKKDRRELFSNPKLLEKYAREKYLMKKANEDVFVIVEND